MTKQLDPTLASETKRFECACIDWRSLLGASNVVTEASVLQEIGQCTFQTTSTLRAVLTPSTAEQVQECLAIADRNRIDIHAVSTGKNWGLGSKLTTTQSSVLLDLTNLNRILDFDEHFGYVTVEPGVTFQQVRDFLLSKGSRHYLSVIGGPPEASLIGNMADRGDSVGPMGDRFANCTNLEVLLPNGEIVHTGFGRFQDLEISKLHKYGVGPSIDGLFTQSNLGIILKATFWLSPRPANFQLVIFGMKTDQDALGASEEIRRLMELQVIRPNSVAIWNRYKFLTTDQQFPWDRGFATPLTSEDLKSMKGLYPKCKWVGLIALYSPSKLHQEADQRIVKRAVRRYSTGLIAITKAKARAIHFILAAFRAKRFIAKLDTLFEQSVFLGHPTRQSIFGLYWRKKFPPNNSIDPHSDRCGVMWICPTVPFHPTHIAKSIEIINECCLENRLEPMIAITFPTSRCAYVLPSIVFDRDHPEEETASLRAHDKMYERFMHAGYVPHRIGIQSSLPIGYSKGYSNFISQIKSLIDPGRIFASGRYSSAD